MENENKNVSPAVVALAGWLLPGLGYWLMGEKARGMVVGVTIILLFASGILLAGVRVIEVPGYGEQGKQILVQAAGRGEREWVMYTRSGLSEIGNKPWYVAQILMGPANIICSMWSIAASDPQLDYPKVKARLGEIGTLYTAVAGMLNLLAMIDSAYRAGGGET